MIVLDASVVAKWFLEEEGSDRAVRYRDAHASGIERILAPGLLLYELANLFRYKRSFGSADAAQAFKALADFGLDIVDWYFDDAVSTILLAEQLDITVYDAAYVELAKRFDCRMVTADEKLYRRTHELGFVERL